MENQIDPEDEGRGLWEYDMPFSQSCQELLKKFPPTQVDSQGLPTTEDQEYPNYAMPREAVPVVAYWMKGYLAEIIQEYIDAGSEKECVYENEKLQEALEEELYSWSVQLPEPKPISDLDAKDIRNSVLADFGGFQRDMVDFLSTMSNSSIEEMLKAAKAIPGTKGFGGR